MRILHLTPYFRPAYAFGGVVRSVEGMAKALAKRGHEVTVLTTDALDHERRYAGPRDETSDGIRVLRCANILPIARARWNLSTALGMKRMAASLLPIVDILHVHEFRTSENLLVMPVAERLGKPIALSPHGTLDLSTGRRGMKAAWDRLFGSAMAARVDHVLALTDKEVHQARMLWKSFGARESSTRFSSVPNGVDLGEFSPLPAAAGFRDAHILGSGPIVLFMGRLQARKGVDVLVKAFLAADSAESRLLIVGPDEGMLPELRRLAFGDPRIIFAGYLAGQARLEAFAAADIFALPANGEGQPMAALEAMAAGLPALLSPGCNMDEVERHGAGYVVEASVEAVADKLRVLLDDVNLRREMGSKARLLVEERYTWKQVAIDLERVYEGMLTEDTREGR